MKRTPRGPTAAPTIAEQIYWARIQRAHEHEHEQARARARHVRDTQTQTQTLHPALLAPFAALWRCTLGRAAGNSDRDGHTSSFHDGAPAVSAGPGGGDEAGAGMGEKGGREDDKAADSADGDGSASDSVPVATLSVSEVRGGGSGAGSCGAAEVESGGGGIDQLSGLDEHTQARLRAAAGLRKSGPSVIALLLWTDQVGPNVVPYAEGALGYVPANVLFVVLGAAAVVCGAVLMHVFCSLDSARFPITSYPDLAQRVAGRWVRAAVVVLQQAQLVLLIGVASLTNGQALESLLAAHGHNMCFTLAVAIWTLVGIAFAQVRTIRGLASLSHLAVGVNIALVVITLVQMQRRGLNWPAIATNQGLGAPPYAPVATHAVAPGSLAARVNGVFNIIYCFGGALIYVEVASEMANPSQFWKGLAACETTLTALYILFANWVYTLAGQYALSPAYGGMAPGKALDAANVLYLLTGILYAAVVGNAVLKGVYSEVIEGLCGGPPRTTRVGMMLWIPFTVGVWGASYAVASAVPQVGTIQGLVSALGIFNFSFTLPPALALTLFIRRERLGLATPRDYTVPLLGTLRPRTLKTALLTLTLACAATSILGIWAAVVSIKDVFAAGGATGTSFGCASTI